MKRGERRERRGKGRTLRQHLKIGATFIFALDAPEFKVITQCATPLTHTVCELPCECAVGDEGIADVYESVILDAVVGKIEG